MLYYVCVKIKELLHKMTLRQIVETVLERQKLPKASIARAENISPQLINYRLNHTESTSVANAMQLLRGCGYKIVAVPKNERVRDGWFELTE
jgi:hypothetical protein